MGGGVQLAELTNSISTLRLEHTAEKARLVERVAELDNLAMMKEEDVSEAIQHL